MLKRKILFCALSLCLPAVFAVSTASAQELAFNYFYSFENADATEPPQITGFDFNYPEAARKNGVEGTLKAGMTLGADGKVSDIKILQTLPFGVEAAITEGLRNLYFQPAKKHGQPVPIRMNFDFVVSAVYDESDKNVSKPQILEKPEPVYPARYAAEKLKGKVEVMILFFADGRMKILGVSSTMPKEFDVAAAEAAARLRFLPAAHRKSKADVSQRMIVVYNFKP